MNVESKRALGRFVAIKGLARRILPLPVRKALAQLVGRLRWHSGRGWLVRELLLDFAERDPDAYHRFLWTHHLGYAETYEVGLRFGADQLHPSRKLLFSDLTTWLVAEPARQASITSVFEVGCSLGYNLRYLETDVLQSATILDGCDIDAYAVGQGSAYLRSAGSRVRLSTADMTALNSELAERMYDVTVCAGVLMYIQRNAAERVVATILEHTSLVAVFAGLADPDEDNARLGESRTRSRDGTFIHNIDDMVGRAGGRIVHRRWEGPRLVDGNSIYFVFATPARA